ncbi:GPP34 family phosphoprotein [Nonomuraea mesophila]|uniref:GPP34 family phosphoprotein n=1 Tax=Nonomuraea mesophila TaxID=2530382 RepID=A0A4V6PGC9_9ACTN|nr:GPP34 family phosphoprotein [Nonomuraea mesophila]TDE43406.1 GPP34 family phosphoprotein [Nonomuraea mesophila]
MKTEIAVKRDESLPQAAFLLAFDLRRERLANRSELRYLLRAAALAELLVAGNLTDDAGKARAVVAPVDPGPLQAAVWEQISSSPPRSWRHWIGKDRANAFRLVRDELVAARLIRVERRRVLLFPVERITLRRPYLSRRLAERVSRAATGGRSVNRLDQDVRILAALAAAAKLKMMPPEREQRRHGRQRIEQLAEPVEPVATALRQNVYDARGGEG